jgi:hypothetical protein
MRWFLSLVLVHVLAPPGGATAWTLSYRYVPERGDPLLGGFSLSAAGPDAARAWGGDRVYLAGHVGITTAYGSAGSDLPGRNVVYRSTLTDPNFFPANPLTGAFTGSGWFYLANDLASRPWQVQITFGQGTTYAGWSGSSASGVSLGGEGHWDLTITGDAAPIPVPVPVAVPEPASVVLLLLLGLVGAGVACYRRR